MIILLGSETEPNTVLLAKRLTARYGPMRQRRLRPREGVLKRVADGREAVHEHVEVIALFVRRDDAARFSSLPL